MISSPFLPLWQWLSIHVAKSQLCHAPLLSTYAEERTGFLLRSLPWKYSLLKHWMAAKCVCVSQWVPSGNLTYSHWTWLFIMSFPIININIVIFRGYVSLPERFSTSLTIQWHGIEMVPTWSQARQSPFSLPCRYSPERTTNSPLRGLPPKLWAPVQKGRVE